MTLTQLKKAIKDASREEVEEIIEEMGEEVLEAALDLDIPVSDIREAYQGEYKSDEDFAQELAEQVGDVDFKSLRWPLSCIDWTFAAKELMYDYTESGGHYFRNL